MKLVGITLVAVLFAGSAACGDDTPAATADATAEAPAGTQLSGAPDATDGDPADVDRAAELASAQTEVARIAPALESFYRGKPYPQSLPEAQASVADAGLDLMLGNTVAGYAYDADTTEFTLCIETASGAWATYDTAPMSLREGAPDGGCPTDLGS